MREATKSFLQIYQRLFFGLFCGFVLHFFIEGRWHSSDALATAMNFVAYVLFNALVLGLLGAGIVSAVVFPIHHFLIKRWNIWTSAVYFVLGLFLGLSSLKFLMALAQRQS